MPNQIQFHPDSTHPLRSQVGDRVGNIMSVETRDGVEWLGVDFLEYGHVCLPASAFGPNGAPDPAPTPEAPKGLLAKVWEIFS